jgi:hypothetical protein
MTSIRVIGVDPGPTPGFCVLEGEQGRLWEADMLQCSARLLHTVLSALVLASERRTLIAVERFVPRGRMTADQSLTRDQVAAIQQLHHRHVVLRAAAQVKPWATDARLEACTTPGGPSLLGACKGMRHARDAARHALFTAVHDGKIPDPLSRRASA